MSFTEKVYQHSPVSLQNIFISAFGYQWKQRRFGGIFQEEYKAAKDRENFTQADWTNYRQQQLQKIVLHAATSVPYYQSAFAKAGVSNRLLQTVDEVKLGQLPVLQKDDLRKYCTTSLLSNIREKNGSFFSTSGSTGTPVKILYSHTMHQRWFAIYEARIRNWAGVSSFIPRGMIGGRRILPDASNTTPFYRYNYFEKQAYFSAYHINAKNAADYLKGITKHNVGYMTGYAMSNYFLARFLKEKNFSVPELKAVITSSEKLTGEMRQTFADVYNCKTFDSWGSVEACGMISECEEGTLHINEDAGIVEILDDDLQPVRDDVEGDVYCTGF